MNVLGNVKYLGKGILLAKPEIQASYRVSKKLINRPKDASLELNFGFYNTLTMLKAIASKPGYHIIRINTGHLKTTNP